jgi:hypothetical protein
MCKISRAITVALLAVMLGGSAASAASQPNQKFKLTSTLDGKTVLPHRIHWLALTNLPASSVKRVDFLIDGRLHWFQHTSPYSYADYSEGADGYKDGYLVTSFLKPGEHRFTVRVITTSGRAESDTVTARVLPAPSVPSALAGTWQRTITDTSGAPAPGSDGNPTDTLTPPGTYKITFDRQWIHDEFPCTTSPCRYVSATGAGGEFDSDWNPGTKTFHVQGEVTFMRFTNSDRLAGWWCQTWGPAANYSWSVSGSTLTLSPVGGHDACGIRGFIWSGTWTRT